MGVLAKAQLAGDRWRVSVKCDVGVKGKDRQGEQRTGERDKEMEMEKKEKKRWKWEKQKKT